METRIELHQRVASLAGLGIWERDFSADTFYWNNIVREILELDADYMPPLSEALYFGNDPGLFDPLIDQACSTCEPVLAEVKLLSGKGNERWVKLHLAVVCEDGKCAKVFGTIEDITEAVTLRQLLKEREMRFTLAFEHAPIGMALVSLKGEWLKVNAMLCDIVGYTEEELTKLTFQDITHPDDLKSDLDKMYALIAKKIDKYSMEKRYFHKDGHIIWGLLNVSMIKNDAGEPLYFVSQIKDITERKRNMEIIREQNARLLHFTHIVSHNLRSHASNFRMLTEMILKEEDTAEKNMLFSMLVKNSDNLLMTLSELNDVVKIHDSGQTRMAVLHLREEVERVITILAATIKQTETNIHVDIDEDATIRYNPAYLESIFINLITNSIKYKHPERSPVIRITAKQVRTMLVLEITDNGSGIDLDLHRHKVFGMYKTFHNNKDARGMGLFLVKTQVEAMGGKIIVNSQPDKGTTFTIEINNSLI